MIKLDAPEVRVENVTSSGRVNYLFGFLVRVNRHKSLPDIATVITREGRIVQAFTEYVTFKQGANKRNKRRHPGKPLKETITSEV